MSDILKRIWEINRIYKIRSSDFHAFKSLLNLIISEYFN